MKISRRFREELVQEIQFVVKKIREEQELRRKVFYYSGVYGLVSRIFNLNFDPELVFMHLVLNATYGALKDRANNIVLGRDTLIEFPDDLFDKLCDALETLAEEIENDAKTYHTLQKIANLAYVTTGNGYYLYQKGILKI